MRLLKKLMLFEEFSTDIAIKNTKIDTISDTTLTVSNNVKSKNDIRSSTIEDIDNILINLKKLSLNITEELTNLNIKNSVIEDLSNSIFYLSSNIAEDFAMDLKDTINEKDAMKTAIDFMIRAPKARKAQSKVNKLKLKIAGIEAAMDASSSDVKAKLKGKVDMMKAQSKDLQAAVNDRWDDKGEIVKKAKQSEKIKGELSILKTSMGEGGVDKDKLKQTAAELKSRLSREEAALKDMEPSKDDKEDAVEQLKKEKEAKEKEAGTKAKEKETETKAKEKETETSNKPTGTNGADDKIQKEREAKNSKEGKIKRYQDLIDKIEDEEKKQQYQSKIDSLQAESLERFMDSKWLAIIESELVLFESQTTSNNSKIYESMSVADKFKVLMYR